MTTCLRPSGGSAALVVAASRGLGMGWAGFTVQNLTDKRQRLMLQNPFLAQVSGDQAGSAGCSAARGPSWTPTEARGGSTIRSCAFWVPLAGGGAETALLALNAQPGRSTPTSTHDLRARNSNVTVPCAQERGGRL